MIFKFKEGCHLSEKGQGSLCWVREVWDLKKSHGNSGKFDIFECSTISLMRFWLWSPYLSPLPIFLAFRYILDINPIF